MYTVFVFWLAKKTSLAIRKCLTLVALALERWPFNTLEWSMIEACGFSASYTDGELW